MSSELTPPRPPPPSTTPSRPTSSCPCLENTVRAAYMRIVLSLSVVQPGVTDYTPYGPK